MQNDLSTLALHTYPKETLELTSSKVAFIKIKCFLCIRHPLSSYVTCNFRVISGYPQLVFLEMSLEQKAPSHIPWIQEVTSLE